MTTVRSGFSLHLPAWLALALGVVASATSVGADENRRLFDGAAAVLQEHCLSCHSGKQPRGQFSVETADEFFADGYVTPGEFADSHLADVVTPIDGQARMPRHQPPLTATERADLANWISAGAWWPPQHRIEDAVVADFDAWSYRPLSAVDCPSADSDWVRTPIDAFIAQGHKQQSLTPAPVADRRTLIRRLTFDLTGLPPTPEQVEQFVNDDSPDAWQTVVDRLLDSPHYGERWARHWLDVVKYADTHGYDKDKLRHNAWPYRDYVIDSLNADKPYAQFVQEQLAADVLFPDRPSAIRGLGFLAAGPWDFIGHVEVPESKQDGLVARNLDRDDMVSNTLNTFCSLTVQCARCHNHKFDPITQRDYYGLQAIFAAVDRADRPFDDSSKTGQQRQDLLAKKRQLEARLTELTAAVALSNDGQHVQSQIARFHAVPVRKSPQFGYHSRIAASPDEQKWVQLQWDQPQAISRLILHPCHDEFAGIGHGFGFPRELQVDVLAGSNWKTIWESSTVHREAGVAAVTVPIGQDVTAIRVVATLLAPRKNDYIFALAELEALSEQSRNLADTATITAKDSIEAPPRWQTSHLSDGRFPQVGTREQQQHYERLFERYRVALAAAWTPQRTAERLQLKEQIARVTAELESLSDPQMVYAAATTFEPQGNFRATNGSLRPIRLLHRGNVGQPGELVAPCVIPTGAGDAHHLSSELSEGERRAALARWITSTDNPFVWRSIVNRVWQYHFGRGLVASPNDFGRMGQQPSHPQLLDWLAIHFRDSGQSLKSLHRLIVTSSVYLQSSANHVGNADIDSSNRFLWRFRRRRLDAEEIRDSMLAVSGVLNKKRGGPGFYLFALERTQHSPHYEYHQFDPADPASHRRSIYRFIVRSQPDPWMTSLDCADSSQSTPTRTETVTALQALSLMNSRFTVTMADLFAGSIAEKTDDLPQQIELALRLTVQRPPHPQELEQLTAYARQHGLSNLCRLLFNLSEFVYVD
ncbi:MAG: PSD1 and planctomycete cytochrome C domain-containing protein [Planctomycetaceae bacterium]|nr:PSD1 and planctomycete cytochrome C domain-containing protein [Planctomycetaceae bacterium]